MNVPRSMLRDHAAMYWFDLRQQFGVVGPCLAVAGLAHLVRTSPPRAILMAALFAANAIFAFSYNVGDSHVFYLPSHLIVALLAAPAIALVEGRPLPDPRTGTPLPPPRRSWCSTPAAAPIAIFRRSIGAGTIAPPRSSRRSPPASTIAARFC